MTRKSDIASDWMVACMSSMCLLALGFWAGVFIEPPVDGDATSPGQRITGRMLATAILIKLLAVTLLVVCVLHRYWILATLNLLIVSFYVIATAIGVFDPPAAEPVFPPETASEAKQ